MTELDLERDFVVILHETQDIVNIAGTVRAMLNMGFWRLRLVRPALYDAYRIAGIAHGSEPLLEQVEFFEDLPSALADVGTRLARLRAAARPRSSGSTRAQRRLS